MRLVDGIRTFVRLWPKSELWSAVGPKFRLLSDFWQKSNFLSAVGLNRFGLVQSDEFWFSWCVRRNSKLFETIRNKFGKSMQKSKSFLAGRLAGGPDTNWSGPIRSNSNSHDLLDAIQRESKQTFESSESSISFLAILLGNRCLKLSRAAAIPNKMTKRKRT